MALVYVIASYLPGIMLPSTQEKAQQRAYLLCNGHVKRTCFNASSTVYSVCRDTERERDCGCCSACQCIDSRERVR